MTPTTHGARSPHGSPQRAPAAGVDCTSWTTEAELVALIEPYRRELHVHCYRLLGSFHDAEDLVQETFLRAWSARATFQGRSTLRAWLYRIATNACLDHLHRATRRAVPHTDGPAPFAQVAWLQPYPDHLLNQAAPPESEPYARLIARETIELAFLTTIQLLPPRQRAALILVDVLDWSAAETAATLGTSVAAVNSALQRARATLLKHRPASRLEWTPASAPTKEERTLLQRYMDATERADLAAYLAVLHDDVRCTMPPDTVRLEGRASFHWMLGEAFGPNRVGDWRCLSTWANRQPAAACYLRRRGDSIYRPFSISVLRVAHGAIAEITAFVDGSLFPAFGLPLTL